MFICSYTVLPTHFSAEGQNIIACLTCEYVGNVENVEKRERVIFSKHLQRREFPMLHGIHIDKRIFTAALQSAWMMLYGMLHQADVVMLGFV